MHKKTRARVIRDGRFTHVGVFPVGLLNRRMRDNISATAIVAMGAIIVVLVLRYL